jgi:hypothetical protein
VGNDGVRGVTGAGQGEGGRGVFKTTKTDDSTVLKKKKIIQPKIKKIHTLFEGGEIKKNEYKNLQKR